MQPGLQAAINNNPNIHAGKIVTISGLQSKPELNGEVAMVTSKHQNGRWVVQVLQPAPLSLSTASLTAVALVRFMMMMKEEEEAAQVLRPCLYAVAILATVPVCCCHSSTVFVCHYHFGVFLLLLF